MCHEFCFVLLLFFLSLETDCRVLFTCFFFFVVAWIDGWMDGQVFGFGFGSVACGNSRRVIREGARC